MGGRGRRAPELGGSPGSGPWALSASPPGRWGPSEACWPGCEINTADTQHREDGGGARLQSEFLSGKGINLAWGMGRGGRITMIAVC